MGIFLLLALSTDSDGLLIVADVVVSIGDHMDGHLFGDRIVD